MKNNEFKVGEFVKVFVDNGYFRCKIASLDELGCFIILKNKEQFVFYDEIEHIDLSE